MSQNTSSASAPQATEQNKRKLKYYKGETWWAFFQHAAEFDTKAQSIRRALESASFENVFPWRFPPQNPEQFFGEWVKIEQISRGGIGEDSLRSVLKEDGIPLLEKKLVEAEAAEEEERSKLPMNQYAPPPSRS
ncbi:hypothetical protein BBP40_010426 [Aspergillus hancockii]|nr:hypothetical protein BBP40_010426 [Aspergillus hancockii]